MPRTLTAQLSISTENDLPLSTIQQCLDSLFAIGFADAQDTVDEDPDNALAAAASELELTCPDLVEGAYTVILLRPDDVADDHGPDRILLQVDGCASPTEAIKAAQRRAVEINEFDDDDADAYFVIACFAGKHDDLDPGE